MGQGSHRLSRANKAVNHDVHTALPFTEDVARCYEAHAARGHTVQDDNKDVDVFRKATATAKPCTDKPTLIWVKALIGYGTPTRPSATMRTALPSILGSFAGVLGDFAGFLCRAPRPGEVPRFLGRQRLRHRRPYRFPLHGGRGQAPRGPPRAGARGAGRQPGSGRDPEGDRGGQGVHGRAHVIRVEAITAAEASTVKHTLIMLEAAFGRGAHGQAHAHHAQGCLRLRLSQKGRQPRRARRSPRADEAAATHKQLGSKYGSSRPLPGRRGSFSLGVRQVCLPNIIVHYAFCIVSEGCLQKGISHVSWDGDGLSINSHIKLSLADHLAKRYEANGLQVLPPGREEAAATR